MRPPPARVHGCTARVVSRALAELTLNAEEMLEVDFAHPSSVLALSEDIAAARIHYTSARSLLSEASSQVMSDKHRKAVEDKTAKIGRDWRTAQRLFTRALPLVPAGERRPAQIKVQSAFKPDILTKDSSPVVFRQWISAFELYYETSNIATMRPCAQKEFLYTCLDAKLKSQVRDAINDSTPVFGNTSCMSVLELLFAREKPLYVRRFNWFKSKQGPTQDALEYLVQIKEDGFEADVGGLTAACDLEPYSSWVRAFRSGETAPETLQSVWENIFLYENRYLALDGCRLIVPPQARRDVLRRLHLAHCGISKTYENAKQLYYWYGMKNDISRLVSGCDSCASSLASQSYEPILPTFGREPMSHLGADLFEISGSHWLVVVDRFSGYPFAQHITRLNTAAIISCLSTWFLEYGLPECIRSEGGPQFRSDFDEFCDRQGIVHELLSPYNPRSNGLAEAAVKSIKALVSRCSQNKEDFRTALQEWRNTPRADGLSPSVAFLGRRQRTATPSLPQPTVSFPVRHSRDAALGRGRVLPPLPVASLVRLQDPVGLHWRRTVQEISPKRPMEKITADETEGNAADETEGNAADETEGNAADETEGNAAEGTEGTTGDETVRNCTTVPMTVEEIQYKDEQRCIHINQESCSQTYQTVFKTSKGVVGNGVVLPKVQDCHETFIKDCFIEYESVPKSEKIQTCKEPLVRDCDIVGEETCSTEFETICETTFHEAQVEDDVAVCEMVDLPNGQGKRHQCRIEQVASTKLIPETDCHQMNKTVCGSESCPILKGERVCIDELKTFVEEVPKERCHLNPKKTCNEVNKVIPKLELTTECIHVPKEICETVQVEAERVQVEQRAGLSSLNELTVHAVAMETWRAFHSQDGPDGSRNALSQVLFPSNVATRSTQGGSTVYIWME
eukprot:snap_masked-scaffold377_size191454-processed-gene-0.8 protein:Tk05672 transcript:snap_masked-scaffold377_size191454-processed-gene-0.8-mRNA-1 annotation:"PREDICTED: uncharacterized protein K02A2.6-like"